MIKSLRSTTATIGLLAATISTVNATDNLAEIRLVNDLDEPRGYCLDVAGGRGTNAPVENGLQAHTCYDYSGDLLEDQAFDVDLIPQGLFKVSYFNVCMTTSSLDAGAKLLLAECKDLKTQHFSLESNGNIVLQANTNLCVTTSTTEKREGRGGQPIHVMRPVSLQNCSPDNSATQTWTKFRF